jgi:hypothetical protein
MVGSDNVCYVLENKGLSASNTGITHAESQVPRSGEGADLLGRARTVSRVCAVCAAPLTKRWQERACSFRCAGKLTPPRRQDGAFNGNYRGGRAQHPIVYTRAFKARNPEKVKAHWIVHRAIKRGELQRPSECSSCARACRPDAHHADYAQPLAVEWLCRKCHGRADRLRAAQDALKATPAQSQQSNGDLDISSGPFNVARHRSGRVVASRAERPHKTHDVKSHEGSR